MILATIGVCRVSYVLSFRYNASSLSTVIENLHQSVFEIPFPAVTLCNFNPIDFNRVNESIKKFSAWKFS